VNHPEFDADADRHMVDESARPETGWSTLNHRIEGAAHLRRTLAESLTAGGHLRSEPWRVAVETVPRELFVPAYFRHVVGEDGFSRWEPVEDGPLDEIYSDDSLVTQLDGRFGPGDVTGMVLGVPTSSATMPSLVVRMWEHLMVDDDSQVAEVGTGTGYSTALACERLGSGYVTSVDVDPDVIGQAGRALRKAGYEPRLQAMDALDGLPPPRGRGYDRVVAACSLRNVPAAWVDACRPGALILLTLSGWLDAFALARLEVLRDGKARGRLLDDPVSFMPARRHAAPGVTSFDTGADNEVMRSAEIELDLLELPVARFLAQLAAPGAQHVRDADGGDVDYFVDIGNDSYAVLTASGRGMEVRQGGPERIWDAIESAVQVWRAAGSPPIDAFAVEVTPTEQTVALGAARWRLPV
jgi:methyltransferase of ATP-grasp peptide maturase system